MLYVEPFLKGQTPYNCTYVKAIKCRVISVHTAIYLFNREKRPIYTCYWGIVREGINFSQNPLKWRKTIPNNSNNNNNFTSAIQPTFMVLQMPSNLSSTNNRQLIQWRGIIRYINSQRPICVRFQESIKSLPSSARKDHNDPSLSSNQPPKVKIFLKTFKQHS